jgi:hypothetical protein
MPQVRTEDRVSELKESIEGELDRPDFHALGERLRGVGVGPADAANLLAAVKAAGRDPHIAALKGRLGRTDDDVAIERWLLLHVMKDAVRALAQRPLPPAVRTLLLDEFAFMTRPDAAALPWFRFHRARFAGMAKLALLRRFPAGLFHWEESGIPRRWLLRIPWRDLPRAARVIARDVGGFGPLVVPHLNPRRKSPWLTETAANRSYYLMAEAIELQPELRGISGASWFRAPRIVDVAPHLAWVNTVFLENGGFVTTVGPADEHSGVFANSPQRRALYDQGTFTPLVGLAIWPRDAVLEWKRAHPEFAPEAGRVRRA